MKSLKDYFELDNGVQIPCVGFGTYRAENGETAITAIKDAIALGYRHIDTAAGYKNEESVGIAVKESGIPREEIFITSKLQNSHHGYENTMAAFEETMKNLDMDYLDLYLIHWPNPVKYRSDWQAANAGTWKAFEELYKAKRIRAIGISNFHPHHIAELMKTAEIAPMVNQIRLCPGETQDELVAYCKDQNMVVQAYSPLGAGLVFQVPEIQEIAQKYGKTIAQVCIRWSLQKGFLPLPKSVTRSRIKENADVFGFELSEQDMQIISNLEGCCGYSHNPDTTTF